jgi:uncharacterized protein (TIGR02217 family)
MSFDESQFPTSVSYGASGGPRFNTNIAVISTGAEQRNQLWTNPRHQWNVSTGIKSIEHYHAVLRFFMSRRGRHRGFRFKDWFDYTSSEDPTVAVSSLDQVLGTGAGPHQLIKTYTDGVFPWVRTITKPVAGTVVVSVSGVAMPSGGVNPWSIDTTTGILTFTGTAPVGTIRAGFEFDVPVRFNIDNLDGNYENFRAAVAPSVDIIEIRI